jgi:SAM-dependent methyltransferase
MSVNPVALPDSALPAPAAPYVLATGPGAVRRLHVLHDIYSPKGRKVLVRAGLRKGMKVADFGCGVGVTSRMLAGMVGCSGSVTGVDIDAAQLEQAKQWCAEGGWTNTHFRQASAYETGLPRDSFDVVYCRFLLLHLSDPAACLREMKAVLKPGGVVVVEDGDLASATSIPPSAMNAFADLFSRLGRKRGLNYSMGNDVYQLVVAGGFTEANLEIHQPAVIRGQNRYFLKWSVEEARTALIESGVIASDALDRTLSAMQAVVDDPNVVILGPRMSQVWARKPHPLAA